MTRLTRKGARRGGAGRGTASVFSSHAFALLRQRSLSEPSNGMPLSLRSRHRRARYPESRRRHRYGIKRTLRRCLCSSAYRFSVAGTGSHGRAAHDVTPASPRHDAVAPEMASWPMRIASPSKNSRAIKSPADESASKNNSSGVCQKCDIIPGQRDSRIFFACSSGKKELPSLSIMLICRLESAARSPNRGQPILNNLTP